MPKRKVSSAEGAAREEKPAPAKVEAKPRKAAGNDDSSDKKVQTKGKRGAKGKQAEVANQETKELPVENGETKNEESAASDEAGEKEAKSDSCHIPCLISGPCLPSCTIQRNIFINYFVNASFLVALETFLRRRESRLIPFFKCKCFFLRGEIICWLFIFWYNQKIVGY
ncbi:non-histone chromosomal protein HMG-14-like [Diceros bicornis minor]|uniref:non-histone chromosomal protein HMG-14-like n=1 Tax=Diceros bicornis minor TaxID=77932 RepID=UPI0026F14ABC|nr:non-histone chromosomal protein HMG-14-like [Diceros bicornis minor]